MLDWFFKRRKQKLSQEQLERQLSPTTPSQDSEQTRHGQLSKPTNLYPILGDEATNQPEVYSQIIKTAAPDKPSRTFEQTTFDNTANTNETNELIQKLIGQSREVESVDNLKIYQLQCAELLYANAANGYRKFLVNQAENMRARLKYYEKERVILLVGATGAGKSTLINGIVNYIFGVTCDDPVRFQLIEKEPGKKPYESQTSMVTAYVLAHEPGFRVPYTITIVDTPGFGDTKGVEQDELTTRYIENLFRGQGIQGTDRLDAVGFVAKTHDNRVTAAQKYVVEAIMRIFGKDVAKNMFVFATHADGPNTTTVQKVLKVGNVPFQACFPFNNGSLYLATHDQFTKLFWDIGNRSFDKFFDYFSTLEPATLTLTKEVLELRKRLEGHFDAVALQQEQHVNILDELARETDAVKAHATEVAKNQNFTYIVPTKHFIDTPCRSGVFAVNCQECGSTCHYPCTEENVETCLVLRQKGRCLICPGHCARTAHYKAKFHYIVKQKNEQRTFYELKKRLGVDEKAAVTMDKLLDELKKEGEIIATKLNKSVQKAIYCQKRLGEIAMRPYTASVADYVNMLIKNEEREKEEGWEVRVKIWRDVVSRAEKMKLIFDDKLIM